MAVIWMIVVEQRYEAGSATRCLAMPEATAFAALYRALFEQGHWMTHKAKTGEAGGTALDAGQEVLCPGGLFSQSDEAELELRVRTAQQPNMQ
ncbi:hypothetical protein HPB47_019744 [Ixodes persulcatus]|uniref:Uncharacterized protein n=1 Tax=Ixodes persulcatus TaxID=34615 RepID=A0AC60QHC1_IXOPE|nr:hypothetical protein HPB47_019744 [Ixodes persulcatus]